MASNFDFLENKFHILAQLGSLAESYCYTDPNSCIMKLGMMGETIVKLMFEYDDIELPHEDNAINRINALSYEGLLTKDLTDVLHAIRKLRNKAVHQNYDEQSTCPVFLEIMYSVCEWFMQTYGDWNYKHHDFVMPKKSDAQVPPSIVLEQTLEEEKEALLTSEAIHNAKNSKKLDKKLRLKQASEMASKRHKTEAETRFMIDEQLRKVGWEADTAVLRYSKGTRPEKGRNLAIAEWPTDSTIGQKGFADYALFVGTKMVGIIEAKAEHVDVSSVLDYQGKDYPRNIRQEDIDNYVDTTYGEYKVPFTFATNGRPYLEQFKQKSGIWFLDLRNPANSPKPLKGWFSPVGIEEKLAQDVAKGNEALESMSYDLLTDSDGLNLRDYQLKAIQSAEKAIINGQREILLAMATGTGKTRTILGMIYRFLKTNRFKRILFLVDRTSLGDQAYDVFSEVKLEDLYTLNEIHNINGLEDKNIDKETRIQVATVQSMVKRIMYNEDDKMPAVSDFDLVIIDEAHRGYFLDKEVSEAEALYRDQLDYQSKYRNVIEYFDAVKIALTATPALHTTQIFGSPIFTYSYREAVIDGYLVDSAAPHIIETKLSKYGIHFQVGEDIDIYNPTNGEITRLEELEDELDYDVEDFNRQVITEDFNRTVLEEITNNLDPSNTDYGKTLIYAVSDAHADMIVSILKEIFAERDVDNDAVMKITGSVGGGNRKKVAEAIKRFKNENFPNIAVTVDLLTTGIDVPEITSLVFLRLVKSRILFEQMLGRATRLCPKIKKEYFDIYDAVGVYKHLESVTSMKPVVANPKVTFRELLDGLELMTEEYHITSQIDQILAKLQRKIHTMSKDTKEQFTDMTGGLEPVRFIFEVKGKATISAKEFLLTNRLALEYLDIRQPSSSRPVVISHKEDELLSHTRGYGEGEKPEDYINAFTSYIQAHINNIAALEIICTKPRDLTIADLKALTMALDREGFTAQHLNDAIKEMTNKEMVADIISIIRRYAIGSPLVSHEERIRNAVNRLKEAHDFTKPQLTWISRMEKYLLNESLLNIQVFDEDSRFRSAGGFKKINKIFGDQLEGIVLELNQYLYDDGGIVA